MNNKKIGFVLFILILGFVGVYFFMPKKRKDIDKEEIEGDTRRELEVIAPPIEQSTGKSNLFDVSTGAGFEAINVQKSNIANDPALMQDIRAKEKIGLNLFAGVTAKPANLYEKYILEQIGGADDTDILLIPESVNDDFLRRLESVKEFAERYEQHENADGREGAINKLIKLANFSELAGYSLFPDFSTLEDDVVCDGNGYGTCKFPKKKKHRSENWGSFIKDVPKICNNFISATKLVDKSLQKYAIQMLRNNGWKFIGIDQPD